MLEPRSSSRTHDIEGEKTKTRGRSPHQDDQAPKRRDISTTQRIRDLDAKIDTINTGANAPVTVDTLVRRT